MKKERAKIFKDMLNKSRKYQWKGKEEVNMDTFVCLPKSILYEYNLNFAALAIYPVLCVKANFEKNRWFELSLSKIAELAGISINTTSKGINELITAGLVERKKKIDGAKQFYKYKVDFIRKHEIEEWKGEYFIFHTCIVESGIWAKLKKPRAKVLYLALRSEAKFKKELYAEIEDIDQNYILNIKNNYTERRWDFFHGSLSKLCRTIRMERSNMSAVIKQLEEYYMVEKHNHNYFMVYLKPKIAKLKGK